MTASGSIVFVRLTVEKAIDERLDEQLLQTARRLRTRNSFWRRYRQLLRCSVYPPLATLLNRNTPSGPVIAVCEPFEITIPDTGLFCESRTTP